MDIVMDSIVLPQNSNDKDLTPKWPYLYTGSLKEVVWLVSLEEEVEEETPVMLAHTHTEKVM